MSDERLSDTAQRVRACMECAELLPYEQRSCPHCGHHEPLLPARNGARTAPCAACAEQVAVRLIFCPRCGADRGPRDDSPVSHTERPQQGGTTAVDLTVLALTLFGPLLMALATVLAFA